MTAQIIDGNALASTLRANIKRKVDERLQQTGQAPGLAVILVGDNPASLVYVAHKERACGEVGIRSIIHKLPDNTPMNALLELIHAQNLDPSIHGILVQVPLPRHMDVRLVVETILPSKDVDGFHPYNIGRLALRSPTLRPCTPYGIIQLIHTTKVDLHGKNAVVVGASNIVGRPMALELLLKGATTTVCHRFTPEKELIEHLQRADIVVSAAGKPDLIKGRWIKQGAIVIDAGITRMPDGSLRGDVEFNVAKEKAAWITPVPGGVGPMTVACLLGNTVMAAIPGGRHRAC